MSFDSSRFDKAWQRYITPLAKQHEPFMSYLAAGASAAEIAETERVIGVALPADLVHLLSRHNGSSEAQVLPGWELFSADRIVREWRVWEELRRDEFVPDGLTCNPAGPIRGDEWWRLGWIPFTGDGGGNHLCIDMDPAPGGAVGQIITMWHDDETREVVAPSLTDFVEMIADDLEAGDLHWDEDWGGVYAPVDPS
ncbi:MAG: SMI1/KNR4 family protein [Terricaulis sp.]